MTGAARAAGQHLCRLGDTAEGPILHFPSGHGRSIKSQANLGAFVTLSKLFRRALCLLPAVLVPASAIAAFDIKPAPIPLNFDGYRYSLVSNDLWRVEATGAGSGPAKHIVLMSKGDPKSTSEFQRQDHAKFWAKTCIKGEQELVFKRTFFLPGPAKTLGAMFNPSFYGSITSVRVLINGFPSIGTKDGYYRLNAGPNRHAKLLRYGSNDIEIRVKKRKETQFQGKCVQNGAKLALDFHIYGEFQADVSLSKKASGPGESEHVYDTIGKGRRYIANVSSRFNAMRNFGPSGVYRATLTIRVGASSSSGGLEVGAVSISGVEFKECEDTEVSSHNWVLQCNIERWAPNGKLSVTFKAVMELIPDIKKAELTIDATLFPRSTETKYDDNYDLLVVHVCRSLLPGPECPEETEELVSRAGD